MSPKPLFSILIANYNNGSYLEECLQSIFNQTYENWEIVVVDDGSLDISNNIYDKNKGHEKITVYRNRRNKGCGYTKRKCIDLAKGEICGFVDPDDAITPDALEIMVEAHAQLKLHGLIYSNHYICDENLRIVKEADYVGQIPKDVKSWAIRIPTISQFATFKKCIYNKSSGICNLYKKAVDKDLYFKLEDLAPVQYINKPLYYYRHHSGSISLGKGAGLADMYELAVRSDALLRNKVSGKFPAINSLSLDDLTHGILYVSFDLLSKGFIFSALIFIMKAFRLNPKYFPRMLYRKFMRSE